MDSRVTPEQLGAWLQSGLQFGAEYQDGLSNHLPMNLVALTRIGADAAACERFIASYTPRLEPLVAEDGAITNWASSLGTHSRNAAYRNFFDGELLRHGRAAVLRLYLTKLAPGVSGGAFHPLIRLHYALEADSDTEVAESLASWCMAYQELAPIVTEGSGSAHAVLQRAQASRPASASATPGNNLYDRLKSAAALPEFASLNGALSCQPATLAELAEIALAIYAGSNNGFLALHLVTSLHAARRSLAYFDDQPAFLAALGQSIVAAYLVLGCPPLRPSAPAATPTWDAILAAASQSVNDHDAKFCYALRDEQAAYADDGYRREAARRMRLL